MGIDGVGGDVVVGVGYEGDLAFEEGEDVGDLIFGVEDGHRLGEGFVLDFGFDELALVVEFGEVGDSVGDGAPAQWYSELFLLGESDNLGFVVGLDLDEVGQFHPVGVVHERRQQNNPKNLF